MRAADLNRARAAGKRAGLRWDLTSDPPRHPVLRRAWFRGWTAGATVTDRGQWSLILSQFKAIACAAAEAGRAMARVFAKAGEVSP